MRLVPLNSVRENTKLGKNLYDQLGRTLLNKGVVLTESLIEKIKNNGIYMLYIEDKYSEGEIEEVIAPELKNKAVNAIKETYNEIITATSIEKRGATSLVEKTALIKKDKYIRNLYSLSESIVDEILSQKDVMVSLVDIKNMSNYEYQHGLSVAIYSIILGMQLGLNKDSLSNLCVGAMLHDIGKLSLDKELIIKSESWTEEELEIVKGHAEMGYDYLKEHTSIRGTSRIIAMQHHERIDGTGYPKGLEGKYINNLAKIVAIADAYDSLTSDPHLKKNMPPNEALEYIMGAAGRYYEYDYVKMFVRKIMPYPEGTLVKLSNNKIGVVKRVNRNYPMRPIVRVLNLFGGGEINLINEISVTITGVQYDDPEA